MKKPAQHECKRCGHTWEPKIDRLPKCCPACKQYAWQTPRFAETLELVGKVSGKMMDHYSAKKSK